MNKFWFFITFCFLIVSCEKANERACLKKSGDVTSKILNPGEFTRLYLKEHLNYVLVQDTVTYVVIKGGKNLIDFVECSISENELTISNNNKCKFLRYKTGTITAEIHFKSISYLTYQGTQILENRSDWNFNELIILLKDAGGSMVLSNFHGKSFNLFNSHGWGDITLSGSADYFLADLNGNGYFDSRNFSVKDSISLITNSSTLSKLNASNCLLKAQLRATGDIWYYGFPIQIWKQELGSGKLIDKN